MFNLLPFRRVRHADALKFKVRAEDLPSVAWLDRLSPAQFIAVVFTGGLVTASAVYAGAGADAHRLRYFQSLIDTATQSMKTALAPTAKRTVQAHGAPLKWKVKNGETAQSITRGCNPNYTGCVPNGRDVDCDGGNGNGPAFTGRVMVIGVDVYGLDRDGDGIGCE